MEKFIIHWNFFSPDDKVLLLYLCAKIYISLVDGEREHWILAVINIVEERCYYFDSLGPSDKAITSAYDLTIIHFICVQRFIIYV